VVEVLLTKANMPKSAVYVPGQEEPYKISRAKIEDFIRCPRCFVLETKHGVKRPKSIPFTLNNAVDSLLKKEFDIYRTRAEVPPIVAAAGLDLVPFSHPDLEKWRENFTGIRYETEDGRFLVTGAVDDLWVDSNGVITVVDYKATGRPEAVTSLPEGGFYDSYRRQLEIYQWLLRKNGFEVSDTAYWLYTTATQNQEGFNDELKFESNLVSHQGDTSWIKHTLESIYRNLNEPEVAGPGDDCDLCSYFDQRANLAIEWHELVWQNCDNCGSRMLKTISGMMSGAPAAGHVSLGCIVSPDDPDWLCPKCDLDEDDE
jgi:RecB family exonuclease